LGEKTNKILFMCIENSSRSQMAEGFAKARGLQASSAGTFPSTEVNPLVVQAMKEKGIDISSARPKAITEQMVEEASIVVLTDSLLEDSLPKNIRKKIGKKLVIWSIADPKGQPISVVRFIRDSIEKDIDSQLDVPSKN
jgi:arsenate reductase (thioredoxin)